MEFKLDLTNLNKLNTNLQIDTLTLINNLKTSNNLTNFFLILTKF